MCTTSQKLILFMFVLILDHLDQFEYSDSAVPTVILLAPSTEEAFEMRYRGCLDEPFETHAPKHW